MLPLEILPLELWQQVVDVLRKECFDDSEFENLESLWVGMRPVSSLFKVLVENVYITEKLPSVELFLWIGMVFTSFRMTELALILV